MHLPPSYCGNAKLDFLVPDSVVETSEGVPVTVTGVAQVKVMTEDELLTTACEQFLGKDSREIQQTILHTLEGHLRAILGKCLHHLISN